jgi:hypothetical protein
MTASIGPEKYLCDVFWQAGFDLFKEINNPVGCISRTCPEPGVVK